MYQVHSVKGHKPQTAITHNITLCVSNSKHIHVISYISSSHHHLSGKEVKFSFILHDNNMVTWGTNTVSFSIKIIAQGPLAAALLQRLLREAVTLLLRRCLELPLPRPRRRRPPFPLEEEVRLSETPAHPHRPRLAFRDCLLLNQHQSNLRHLVCFLPLLLLLLLRLPDPLVLLPFHNPPQALRVQLSQGPFLSFWVHRNRLHYKHI
jgi:hypothetical protein